ncbi:YidH family protein [Thermomonospora umbrina]|uniref:Putative membrane protein n=1 Tax=Thermomonospora umbrina TaxID=111806 RepID=A0A3D9SX79_9ACTN|nr:DUF202 domain-containing protein [Thermomonospora umbrina]REE97605.1 putative membrane protein [Thermomonospora umbrina]
METNEPDPRFTLANERTFLAWVRTSLALIAGGVALAHLGATRDPVWVRLLLAAVPTLAGALFCVLGFLHWRSCDRALREESPLPPPRFAAGLAGLVVVFSLVMTGVLVLDEW